MSRMDIVLSAIQVVLAVVQVVLILRLIKMQKEAK